LALQTVEILVSGLAGLFVKFVLFNTGKLVEETYQEGVLIKLKAIHPSRSSGIRNLACLFLICKSGSLQRIYTWNLRKPNRVDVWYTAVCEQSMKSSRDYSGMKIPVPVWVIPGLLAPPKAEELDGKIPELPEISF